MKNDALETLFSQNQQWADDERRKNPQVFAEMAKGQQPEYLWIGCSDSRVPSNTVVGLTPGEMFVHRNIANLVVHSDLSSLCVIQYAVDVLKVKHIIVCGHYGCGGVHAAMSNAKNGLIDNWLQHIKDVEQAHSSELASITDEQQRFDRLCELNAIAQSINVANTSIVKDAWARGQDLTIHAVIYSIAEGQLKDLNKSMSHRVV